MLIAQGEANLAFRVAKMITYYVYILKCSDDTYYTGITSNLDKRLNDHNSGIYRDSYTSSRRPLILEFYAEFTNVEIAIEWEKKIKGWSRRKKQALIEGDYELLIRLAKKCFQK